MISTDSDAAKTLRDEFAMAAMQGMMHGLEPRKDVSQSTAVVEYAVISVAAYHMADAMLAADEKQTFDWMAERDGILGRKNGENEMTKAAPDKTGE